MKTTRRDFIGSTAAAAAFGLNPLCAWASGASATAAAVVPSLSPAQWPAGLIDRYFSRNDKPTFSGPGLGARHPLFKGKQGMVLGTTGNVAAYAGLQALQLGGSAIDAAITTALAQICLAGGSWVSYAGFTQIMYFEASSGRVHNLNAAFNIPRNETDPLSIPKDDPAKPGAPLPDARTALVPGFMAGIEAAHQRWGKLPFKSLFEPAIHFAEQGFPASTLLAGMMVGKQEVLSRLPATKAVYTKPDGGFYAVGETFKQPGLAKTLRICATEGVQSHIYEGEWAEQFVAAVQADGGKITMEDMRNYQVMFPEPASTRYGNRDVHTVGLPAYGGIHVLQSLNLMDVMGMRDHGHYAQSPDALFRLIQAGTALRTRIFWAMESKEVPGIDLSLAERYRKSTAEALWQAAQEGRIPDALLPPPTPSDHSDGLAVIDAQGNVVAMTHTINTGAWGSTGINVGGISIPDSAKFQQQQIANAGPGQRLPDPTAPLIVTQEGRPVLAFGSIGSGLHWKTLCALSSALDFGMDPKQAIDTPALMDSFSVETAAIADSEFDPSLIQAVEAMGQAVRVDSGLKVTGGRGYLVALARDLQSGEISGAIPGEFLGGAEAY